MTKCFSQAAHWYGHVKMLSPRGLNDWFTHSSREYPARAEKKDSILNRMKYEDNAP